MDLPLAALQSVGGLAVVLLILVQLVKSYLAERAVPIAAAAAGVVLCGLATVAIGPRPVPLDAIAQAVLTGFLGGAAAVGLYQVQKPARLLPPK